METELLRKEKQLQSELNSIRELKEKQAIIDLKQKNYSEWEKRKPLWLLGKAYCTPNKNDFNGKVTDNLGIYVSVPGNCSHTYQISETVPSAVVLYFHNLFNDGMRRKLQSGINRVLKGVLEEFLGNPKCVLDMLGLQNDNFYLRRADLYPSELIEDMEKEINEERFKVIDQFKESQLLGISDELSHSRSILFEYAKSRGLKKLVNEFKQKYHWAK